MNPLKAIQNASILVRCAALSIAVAALCALIVFESQHKAETAPAVSALEEPIIWRMDPYIPIRVDVDTFEYEIGETTQTDPAITPMGVSVFAVLVKHDSTDLPNHVEDYAVEEMLFTDPRAQLLHVVKTGNSTWTSTQAVEATRELAEKRAKDLAQAELELQGKLSVDISSFNYDSVTVMVEGVVLATVDAAYPLPMMAMPTGCLTGDAAAKANYVLVFGNDFGYVAVAKSLDGFRGKIDSDIQLCWVNGQKGALKALRTVAAEFEGMAHGNEVVWHEPTKATVLSADFISPPAKPNNNR